MKHKLTFFVLILVSLFLFNSCELLNPLIGGKTNKLTPIPDPQNFAISIERTHGTIQGQSQAVEITLQNNTAENYQLGGFDFVIGYNAAALTFQSADPGQFLVDCGWEYFTYRYGANGNCETDCPSGEIRITVIAETNNGAGNHPVCFNIEGAIANQLTVLNFLVTNDRSFECAFAPIQFYWYDCGDNIVKDVSGNLTFLSEHIYIQNYFTFDHTTTIDYNLDFHIDTPFPSYSGSNNSCDNDNTFRNIDFINGGIDIVCVDSIDARGDINLNEISYEFSDAVLFSNYFVYGMSVFLMNVDASTAASDVNADGLTLTVADLVYLIRVLVGDAVPYPANIVNDATYTNGDIINNDGILSIENINAGAAHLVVKGDIQPTLLANGMTMFSNFDGANTNTLIYSLELNSFSGEFINIGNNELVSMAMADRDGNQIIPKLIPQTYVLGQNYPNPFNPTTTIPFSMPQDAFVTLDIYNTNGQKVASFSGNYVAGSHAFEWDATNSPSGTYRYTLRINNFVDSKTMLKVG